jgi:hypothetical protein
MAAHRAGDLHYLFYSEHHNWDRMPQSSEELLLPLLITK